MPYVNLVVFGIVMFFSEYAFSQKFHNPLQRGPAKKPFVIPMSENPRESLTIIISSRTKPGSFSNLPGRKRTVLSYYLNEDGTFEPRGFALQSKPLIEPVEYLRNRIKLWGSISGHCVLDLWVQDDNVDFFSLVKAIQSLNGIEKEFDVFQIEASFLKASPKLPTTKPVEQETGPVGQIQLNEINQ